MNICITANNGIGRRKFYYEQFFCNDLYIKLYKHREYEQLWTQKSFVILYVYNWLTLILGFPFCLAALVLFPLNILLFKF